MTGLVSPSGSDTVTFNLYEQRDRARTPARCCCTNDTDHQPERFYWHRDQRRVHGDGDGDRIYWVATYNGDSNNSAVTSGPAAEPVTITPGPTTLVAANVNKAPGPGTCSRRG